MKISPQICQLEDKVQFNEYQKLQIENMFLEERLRSMRLEEKLRSLEQENEFLKLKLVENSSSLLPMEELKSELESVVKENGLLNQVLNAMEENKKILKSNLNDHDEKTNKHKSLSEIENFVKKEAELLKNMETLENEKHILEEYIVMWVQEVNELKKILKSVKSENKKLKNAKEELRMKVTQSKQMFKVLAELKNI